MSLPVKLFNAKVTDEYGGEYPLAIVGLRMITGTLDFSLYSENLEGTYEEDESIVKVAFKASYWYSAKTKAEGKRSRPLMQEIDGKFTDVFSVELTKEEFAKRFGDVTNYKPKALEVSAGFLLDSIS